MQQLFGFVILFTQLLNQCTVILKLLVQWFSQSFLLHNLHVVQTQKEIMPQCAAMINRGICLSWWNQPYGVSLGLWQLNTIWELTDYLGDCGETDWCYTRTQRGSAHQSSQTEALHCSGESWICWTEHSKAVKTWRKTGGKHSQIVNKSCRRGAKNMHFKTKLCHSFCPLSHRFFLNVPRIQSLTCPTAALMALTEEKVTFLDNLN